MIGTTSPLNSGTGRGSLSINGATDSILVFGNGGTTSGYLYSYSTGLELTTQGSRALVFQTNNTERMRIDSSGNVGIGTSTLNPLGWTKDITINSTGNASYSISYGDAAAAYFYAGASAAGIASYANIPLTFGTNNTERMRIDSSGNLGLGVTPSAWNTTSYRAIQISSGVNLFGQTDDASVVELWANGYVNSSYSPTYKGTGNATRYRQTSGQHQWYTAASGTAGNAITFTQAMTLDASGNLLVGTTSSSITTAGIKLSSYSATSANISIGDAATANTDIRYTLYSTGAAAYRFYVGMGGTIYATSIVITAISDERLKENIRDLDTGLSTIMALKPRRFDWKEGKGQDKKNAAGFIAQEFQKVLPNSISTFKAGEDGIDYLTMNHEELIPTLVKAIQDQQLLIESLTTRLTALENK
jgi:hypothetical protein